MNRKPRRRTRIAGFDDVGYPKLMRPLGYSYSIGQAALHDYIPADPQDPGMPHPDHLLPFLRAVMADAFAPIDELRLEAGDANAKVRAAWRAFLRNGPLPTDVEVLAPTADESQGWSAADQILRTRYVYWYDSTENYGNIKAKGVVQILDDTAAMYLQIQGYSASTHSWVLPRKFGQQCLAWRYDNKDPAIPTGPWKYVFSAGQWMVDNTGAIASAIITVAGAMLAAFTGGASLGVAGAVIASMRAMMQAAMSAAVSGRSVDWFPVALQAGEAVLKEAGPALERAISRLPEAHQAIVSATAALAKVEKAIGTTIETLDKDIGKAIPGTFRTWIDTAQKAAKAEGWIPEWAAVTQLVGGGGGLDQDGRPIAPIASVGRYFAEQARGALHADELEQIFSNVPWYAKGHFHLGAVTRAIEIGTDEHLALRGSQRHAKPVQAPHPEAQQMRMAAAAPQAAPPVAPPATPYALPPTPPATPYAPYATPAYATPPYPTAYAPVPAPPAPRPTRAAHAAAAAMMMGGAPGLSLLTLLFGARRR